MKYAGSSLDPDPEVAEVSQWCNSAWKRMWDLFWGLLLLILLAPLMALIALGVKLSSPGPVFFRQARPGRGGKEFCILKFRSMVANRSEEGPVLTRAADPRVTPIGRLMRKWKLDELPQLFNVIRGDMSFVGPRPQVTRLWTNPLIREESVCVLSVRPGITSQTTLAFRNEEELLSPCSSGEVEEVYLREIMPLKLSMEIEYLTEASFMKDLRVILMTVARVFIPQRARDGFLQRQLDFASGSLGASLKNTAPATSSPLSQPRITHETVPGLALSLREVARALQSCENTGEFCMILQKSLMPHGFDGFGFHLYSSIAPGAGCFPLQQAGHSRFHFFWDSSDQSSSEDSPARNWRLTFPLQNGHRIGRFTLYCSNARPPREMKQKVFTSTGLSRELARTIDRLQTDWLDADRAIPSTRRGSASVAGD